MEPLDRTRAKWRAPGAGARYAGTRFRAGREARDPARLARLLERHLGPLPADAPGPALLLDAPCGAGRLFPTLAARGRVVGLDVSPAMLEGARARGAEALLAGDLAALPFAAQSFDAVVCCRLLHHLEREEDLVRIARELVRVSRALVLVTYWDAASLPALRRRLLPSARAPRRFARPRAAVEAAFVAAGAEVVERAWSLRFVSRQAYLVLRRRA